MKRFLIIYRKILDSAILPAWIRRFVERIGLRLFRPVMWKPADRQDLYLLNPNEARPFFLALDWYDGTDVRFLLNGLYERANALAVLRLMKSGGIFVDVGANVGFFSFLVAGSCPSSRVCAIEPVSRNIRALRKAKEANGSTNVEIIHAAVSDGDGETKIKYRFLDSGSPSIVGYFGSKAVVEEFMMEEDVRLVSLVSLMHRNGDGSRVRCVKIDAQGAELDVLKGAKKLLEDGRIEHLIIEHNETAYGRKVRDFLLQFGYVPHHIGLDGTLVPLASGEDLRHKRDYLYASRGAK